MVKSLTTWFPSTADVFIHSCACFLSDFWWLTLYLVVSFFFLFFQVVNNFLLILQPQTTTRNQENVLPIGCYRPRPCALRRLRSLAGVGLRFPEFLARPLRHPRSCQLRTSGQHFQPWCWRGIFHFFLFLFWNSNSFRNLKISLFFVRTTKSVCTLPTNGPALLALSPKLRAHQLAACSSTSSDTLPETTQTVIDSFFLV